MVMTTAPAQPGPDAQAETRDHPWSADDFERACESGAFGWDRRLELVHGRVIDRMPESPLHAFLAMLMIEALRALLPRSLLVRGEKPIRLAFDGDPIPDISIVRGPLQDYWHRHPSPEDVALLVEIAISSAKYDLGEKALLYTQAGISDYWVVLPEAGALVVHRDPTPQGYGSVTRLDETATVAPLAAGDVTLAVRDLLGASG